MTLRVIKNNLYLIMKRIWRKGIYLIMALLSLWSDGVVEHTAGNFVEFPKFVQLICWYIKEKISSVIKER